MTATTLLDPTTHPMLAGFAAMHAAMRRDAARLPGAIAAADPGRAAALVRWYTRFGHTIEAHHTREDDVIWPRLAERSATFAAALPVLEDDHHALDVALAAAGDAIAALAADPTEPARAAAIAAAEELATILVDHLDREESAAFDEIVLRFTEAEWTAIEEAVMRQTPVRALAFEAPWALLAQDEAVRAELIADAPAPLRLLYRWTFLPRYQRLVADAGM
jgi:hemerythrin-like domain-containing protein